jgi:adenylyl-sulfate kinase
MIASSDGPRKDLTVWFTGLSGSGKTTLSRSAYGVLVARGFRVELLDGDDLRKLLNRDFGFIRRDCDENVHRIGFVADLLARNGILVLVSAIAPYRDAREEVRRKIDNFMEVHVNAPLEVCEKRDPSGLYRRARAGEIQGFTGIHDPYEAPLKPELRCDTHEETVERSTDKVIAAITLCARMDAPDHFLDGWSNCRYLSAPETT